MERKGSAVWKGSLKDGAGSVSTESGVLDNQQYSFATRFENGRGTNPEELLAAAHAGCFTMDLSNRLGKAGLQPDSVQTEARVTLEQVEGGFEISRVHLQVRARLGNADRAAFLQQVEAARTGCPVSKLFKAEIQVEAEIS